MQPDLSLKQCSKSFGDFEAVRSVSFDIPKGHFFSILGPSGCGKTTLLRMIAGFIEPSAGEILIGGNSMRGIAPNRRPVSLVFQHLALFPMMSVARNIAFGLERRRMSRKRIEEKVREMLETVGLPGYGDKQVHQLSGGQRQRVAIARCLVLEPTVLLLDEPLGALDLKLREQMKIELKKLQAEVGTTFLYITHDQSEALVMSDKIAVMNEGRMEQLDTPFNCYRNPATPFVAGFLGESNRWQGKVTKASARAVTVETDAGHKIECRATPGLKTGQMAEVFVRSEAFSLDGAGKFPNRLDALVVNNLFDGSIARIQVKSRAEDREIMVTLPQTARGKPPVKGDAVRLAWGREDSLCFAVGAGK